MIHEVDGKQWLVASESNRAPLEEPQQNYFC